MVSVTYVIACDVPGCGELIEEPSRARTIDQFALHAEAQGWHLNRFDEGNMCPSHRKLFWDR